VTGMQKYPITEYQPVYFATGSFEDAQRKMSEFASTIPKSFKARYDPYTQRIELLDTKTQILKNMRGVGREFNNVEEMIEKLGPKGTAEAFIKAHKYFEENTGKEPEDERPKPMTAKEWREVLAEDAQDDWPYEGEEEELIGEGYEEEDFGEEPEEEEAGEEDGGEPDAKKQRTE